MLEYQQVSWTFFKEYTIKVARQVNHIDETIL